MFRRLDEPACNICGHTRFKPGPGGRLSRTRKLPTCAKCSSYERHRSLRLIYDALPVGMLKWRRTLQFSRDPSIEGLPIKSFELTRYGRENSIDVQKIEREDGSYDLVVLNHVLECVPDLKAGIRELIRILSPEGILQLAFARANTREKTQDFTEPQGDDHIWHLFGRDVLEYFDFANLGVDVFVDRGVDPVTDMPHDFYFISRSPAQIDLLRSYAAFRRDLEARAAGVETMPARAAGAA